MKHVLITGASRGLGKEIATTLSKKGYKVAINYLKSEKEAERLVSLLNNAISIKADVGEMKQVKEMGNEIRKRWGRLDTLINNAGITKDNLLIKTTPQDWDEVIRVNLKGSFNTIKVFTPLLIESGGGHIINISSYSGLRGKAGQSAYSASKSSIFGLTYTLAKELAGYNIRVNALCPGYMQTEMGLKAEEAMEKAKEESTLKRLSEPKEVAGFIAWLLETEAITGQVFMMDSRV